MGWAWTFIFVQRMKPFIPTLSRQQFASALTLWSLQVMTFIYINGNGVQGSDSDLPTTVGGFPLKPPTYTEAGTTAKQYVLDLN
jgi:hypothetical protein